MAITQLSGQTVKDLFAGGLANLRNNSKKIDELNVFPVPDGDTGSNMLMTLEGAMKSIVSDDSEDISALMPKFARGALLGARGNSGVILSQFIKGFANGCEGKETLQIADFTESFHKGVERAYEAVIRPTEGTILTVMREGWEHIDQVGGNITNFQDYFARLLRAMDESLEHTPELLPVLKESGVIDSGGAGFICIFRGMEMVLNGEKITDIGMSTESGTSAPNAAAFNADSELTYGYCTEFILQLQNKKVDVAKFDINRIINYLESVGNSIVAIKDDDLVKVHVHTFNPGDVLNFGQNFGEYITLKIENMSVQHNENSLFHEQAEPKEQPKVHKDIAVVAVVTGSGLKEYFTELGVDICVDGGQTENPSTADFLQAFEQLDADNIIVLPCNSNIVMAAEQAAELYEHANVYVVPAKTIPAAYAALSMMNLNGKTAAQAAQDMAADAANASCGLITTSIRDVDYSDVSVTKGHYIGLDTDRIISDSADRTEAAIELLKGMDNIRDREVITVFYGADVSEEETERLGELIEQALPWVEYGFIFGGQEIYDYIFSVE